jgi:hypothetical protein
MLLPLPKKWLNGGFQQVPFSDFQHCLHFLYLLWYNLASNITLLEKKILCPQ